MTDFPRYPYGSRPFMAFVSASYRVTGAGDPAAFLTWMERAYRQRAYPKGSGEPTSLAQALEGRKREVASVASPEERARREREAAAWLHRTVKRVIPRFSLERGFEFANAARLGERQCFLQSVLIAAMLQRMGIDAGVAMVYRNLQGQETNNGHAVALARLSNGRDLLVDASDPQPFPRQQGLFATERQSGQYRYVDPVYEGASPLILGYRLAGTGQRLAVRDLLPLDASFLRSQFDYYRGERTPGGLLAPPRTARGLEEQARWLRISLAECARNPLPAYLLGKVYLAQAKSGLARQQVKAAYELYRRAGWVPRNSREALAQVARGPAAGAGR